MHFRDERQAIAYSAAGIFAGAAFVGAVETAIPGGPEASILPGIAAVLLAPLIVAFGPRLSRSALVVLGPLGVVLIGFALASTHDYGDGAVLYMWPVLWMAYFFGTRGTIFVVAWVGVVHAGTLLALPPEMGNVDRWVDVVMSTLVVGAVVRFLAARNDKLLAEVRAEARVDPLTGLLNRRGFQERLGVEVARAIRDGDELAVVAFDIDHFKRVNDAHGHEAGDRVLAWLGSVLTEQARATDVVGRVGGEEFVVVLPRADSAGAYTFADRVRSLFERPGPRSGRGRFGVSDELELRISGGVASSTDLVDVQELLDEADRALYAAKRGGRNRIVAADRPRESITV